MHQRVSVSPLATPPPSHPAHPPPVAPSLALHWLALGEQNFLLAGLQCQRAAARWPARLRQASLAQLPAAAVSVVGPQQLLLQKR